MTSKESVREHMLKQADLIRERAKIFFESDTKRSLGLLKVANDIVRQDIGSHQEFTFRNSKLINRGSGKQENTMFSNWNGINIK